jgi:protein ImuB
MTSLWLYIHFPNLQLDALFREHEFREQNSSEHIKDQPLIILDPQENKVLQLNKQALDVGIRVNMSLGSAAMLERDLQVLPYDRKVEQKKLQEVADSLYLLTSDITFFEPQGLLLRIHNMLNLYGGLSPYWKVIQSQLDGTKLHYHYATGHSPLAAKMLAQAAWDQVTDNSSKLKSRVKECTLQQTELEQKIIQKLLRVGIHSVRDLLNIPLADIAKRFNLDLVTYLGKLNGEFKHPVDFYHPTECFSRYLELPYEIDSTLLLQYPLQHILGELEQFLKVRDLLTQRLILTFHLRDQALLEVHIGSEQGEYLAQKWLNLSTLKLESIKLKGPVLAISLKTEGVQLNNPQKQDLFSRKNSAMSNFQLVSLLQAKLGEHAVLSLKLVDDYRPELANIYSSPLKKQVLPQLLQGLRPSFLLAQPERLKEQISIIHGPERLCTGWWDNQGITRDYFVARGVQGQWFWVYRTPGAHWFLHGVFS